MTENYKHILEKIDVKLDNIDKKMDSFHDRLTRVENKISMMEGRDEGYKRMSTLIVQDYILLGYSLVITGIAICSMIFG